MRWPWKRKAAPKRFVPTPPYVSGEAWGVLGPAATMAPEAAEALACVLSAVNAIAGTIASLPAYVTRADDSRADVPDHPLQRLIDNGVNDNESWSDFIEGLLASALLRGNALAELDTNDRGELRGLKTVPWANVTPWVDDAGELLFDYLPTLPPEAGKRRRLLREECLYLRDRANNGVVGVSRLQRAASALTIAVGLERQVQQFSGNIARPAGILMTEARMDPGNARRIAQDFDENYSGQGMGKTGVLDQGLKFERYSMLSAEDAQIVDQRNFSVADVARIFNVPPYILADPTRSTFASSREASRQFAMQALSPWVTKLERAFRQTVLASVYRLHFDLGDLLRADPEARWASWQKARMAGVLSPNDVRLEEGWPASTDPTADQIAPPVVGGAQPGSEPAAPPANEGKAAPLVTLRRPRHG